MDQLVIEWLTAHAAEPTMIAWFQQADAQSRTNTVMKWYSGSI